MILRDAGQERGRRPKSMIGMSNASQSARTAPPFSTVMSRQRRAPSLVAPRPRSPLVRMRSDDMLPDAGLHLEEIASSRSSDQLCMLGRRGAGGTSVSRLPRPVPDRRWASGVVAMLRAGSRRIRASRAEHRRHFRTPHRHSRPRGMRDRTAHSSWVTTSFVTSDSRGR